MKKVQILGMNCPGCRKLAENVMHAANGLGIDVQVEKVTDLNEILKFGVMMTPALVIDGEVKSAGNVVPVDKLAELLRGKEE